MIPFICLALLTCAVMISALNYYIHLSFKLLHLWLFDVIFVSVGLFRLTDCFAHFLYSPLNTWIGSLVYNLWSPDIYIPLYRSETFFCGIYYFLFQDLITCHAMTFSFTCFSKNPYPVLTFYSFIKIQWKVFSRGNICNQDWQNL